MDFYAQASRMVLGLGMFLGKREKRKEENLYIARYLSVVKS